MAELNQNVLHNPEALALVLKSLLADITNIRTALNTAITKLNSDGGVTDTDYSGATALTTTGRTSA